jgi:ectoine hydroxylase-related dioxygenase (phytanoyl-CoA dioxygenase family)
LHNQQQFHPGQGTNVAGYFEAYGFAVIPDVVSGFPQLQGICAAVSEEGDVGVRSRKWLAEPWCQDLAVYLRRNPAVAEIVPPTWVAVQCTLFEKSPRKNWLVSLHQDLSIPVKERVASSAVSGWSTKDGVLFVQPPDKVLESLVALRVHLDDCGPQMGALRVVPGSHRFGRLDGTRASALRNQYGETTVAVSRGGILAMRPLLLHASSKATVPSLRRVLHFVFGPPTLPLGLAWADAL